MNGPYFCTSECMYDLEHLLTTDVETNVEGK